MKVGIEGIGWVTPFGSDPETILRRLEAGERGAVAQSPQPGGRFPRYYVPTLLPQSPTLARMPRIRRSGAISYFGVSAGLAALEDAGLASTPAPEGTAVIFAICSGGVQYTRRLYEKIVEGGPAAASPLLFPETVHNAPASHLASALGIDQESYTIIGDGTAGLAALRFAAELLACRPALQRCVVVGSEEYDWILWEGYRTWRLCSHEPCVRLHRKPPAGMLLGEGAAALVVARPQKALPTVEVVTGSYPARREAGTHLSRLLETLPVAQSRLGVGSANGTWVDSVEADALQRFLPRAARLYPKVAFGDPLGAGALMQTGLAVLAMRKHGLGQATVTSVGLNQLLAAAVVQSPG